ncbi:MAG: hypothetical protein Q7S00_00760, partial [bacterium]|nr:hypothetical protein [bacterium]
MKLFLALLLCLPLTASAQSSVEGRLQRLETTVAQMQQTADTNNQNVAEALVTFGEMREEFLLLKGSLGEIKHFLDEHMETSGRRFQELDQRLSSMEEKIALLSNQINEILTRSPEGTAAPLPPMGPY